MIHRERGRDRQREKERAHHLKFLRRLRAFDSRSTFKIDFWMFFLLPAPFLLLFFFLRTCACLCVRIGEGGKTEKDHTSETHAHTCVRVCVRARVRACVCVCFRDWHSDRKTDVRYCCPRFTLYLLSKIQHLFFLYRFSEMRLRSAGDRAGPRKRVS